MRQGTETAVQMCLKPSTFERHICTVDVFRLSAHSSRSPHLSRRARGETPSTYRRDAPSVGSTRGRRLSSRRTSSSEEIPTHFRLSARLRGSPRVRKSDAGQGWGHERGARCSRFLTDAPRDGSRREDVCVFEHLHPSLKHFRLLAHPRASPRAPVVGS